MEYNSGTVKTVINLDDPSVYKQYDSEGMANHLRKMPQLCQQAWQLAMKFNLPKDYAEVNKIVILGMGGSAIGGSLVSSLTAAEAKLPVIVYRDYILPVYVDSKTLVIASSYSGNTEETLSGFEQALETKAKKLAITTGGKLKTMAEEKGIPIFAINYKAPPRAALAFSFIPLLCFLQKLGFVRDKSTDLKETIVVLEQLVQKINESVPTPQNAAKQMAGWLCGKIPVIYGAGITAEVAYRWKTQFNENSKACAFHQVFPELNHNAVVGYQFPEELKNKIQVVMLNSTYLNKRTQLRYRITAKLLEQARIGYQMVAANGASALSQMMGLVLLGDYVSYYLAILYQIDPTPVKVIDFLKAELAKEE